MNFSSSQERIPIPIPGIFVNGNDDSAVHPPPPPPPEAPARAPALSGKKRVMVKYRECLKNHAVSIGGNATDGCGEFMPSGKEGTLEALKCSACHCHRNFHRKEVEGVSSSCDFFHFIGARMATDHLTRASPHQLIAPLGIPSSESDEIDGYVIRPAAKKRFRTKFSAEQKEKMLGFAERVGWRLQKQEEGSVQQLCQEIGVKRRALKVWMHNNKQNLAKKSINLQLDWSAGATTVTDH